MKIAVIGSGAMGSLIGGLLRESGEEVYLYDIWKEHIEKIRREGLKIEGIGGERFVKIDATYSIEDIGTADLIIVFVKSYNTKEAALEAKKILKEDTVVLTLQNGLGNVDILKNVLGSDRVIAGTTAQGATLVSPGVVKHTGHGDVFIGELDGSRTERVEQIISIFNRANIKTMFTDNVEGLIWTKLLVNLAINAPATIIGVKNGELVRHEHSKNLMKMIVDEALQIVEKKGIRLIYKDILSEIFKIAEKTSENINSMFQDILKKKKTEIDFLNGAVAEEGRKLGIDTPVNRAVTYMIKTIEETSDLSISR